MPDGSADRVFGAVSSTTAHVYGDARGGGIALEVWVQASGETLTQGVTNMATGTVIDFAPRLGAEVFRPGPRLVSPLIGARRPPAVRSSTIRLLARGLDLALAAIALLVLMPVILIISIMIKANDGGPILFGQERIGLHGRRFRCWKFRSMVQGADAKLAALLASDSTLRHEWELNHKLKNDPRTTAFGRFLRRTSLDELPQFFNILRGDMSVVGPRPIVDSEIKYYDRWYKYYVMVKPGLTGLWQVSGRNDVSYRRRVAMDRFFYKSLTPALYIFILLSTLPAVVQRRGSY